MDQVFPGDGARIGFKDPRLCLTLPFWRTVTPVDHVLICLREPGAVADSLLRRNGIDPERSASLWVDYVIGSWANSPSDRRTVVGYEDLIERSLETARDLAGALGLDSPSPEIAKEITGFTEPTLSKSASAGRGYGASMALAEMVYESLTVGTPRDADDLMAFLAADRGRRGSLRADFDTREAELERKLAAEVSERERRENEAAKQRRARERHENEAAKQRRALERRLAAGAARQAELQRGLTQLRDDLRGIARSRSWRYGRRLVLLGRMMVLQFRGVRGAGAIDSTLARVETLLEESEADGQAVEAEPHQEPAPAWIERSGPAFTPGIQQTRVAVVAWDAGHNPMGRAFLLADMLRREFAVEIFAPSHPRYGTGVWGPLRDADIPIHVFPGRNFPEQFREMERAASRLGGEAVVVSKPRYPSLGLGMLAKELDGRPLILDVDDRELAFFGDKSPLDLDAIRAAENSDDFLVPHGRLWTRCSDSLVRHADAITVSNPELRRLYGGTLVPHARDEREFDPSEV